MAKNHHDCDSRTSFNYFDLTQAIVEKISWDARSILIVVFLTASANFRPHFQSLNPSLTQSLPYPHQTMLRGPTRKLTT